MLLAVGLSMGLPAAARAQVVDPYPAAVWLNVPDSSAPPGGVIQLDLALTEPAPIVTAMFDLIFDPTLGPVLGAALFSPAGALSDVIGTAVPGAGRLTVRTSSPSAQFGLTAAHAPIVSVALAVPPTALVGTSGAVAIDTASSLWLNPDSQPYGQLVDRNGTFVIGGTLSVQDVSPGLGLLPAGSTVAVRGVGFEPGAIVEIDGVPVASTAVVSATEIDVAIAVDADLYGRSLTVRNPDLTSATTLAYPRTAWLAPSARPLLAATEPIFSPQTFFGAVYANAASGSQFLGVALQNASAGPANVTLALRSAAGLIASTTLALPPLTRISREVSELFEGTAAPADAVLGVSSDVPVQMLGVVGDDAAGSVAPLVAAVVMLPP
jgi:hypothetical protein